MNNLKLKEILWEITLSCNKNCKYCGSKNVLNSISKEDEEKNRTKILQRIIDYPPEEITLTGGEPSNIPFEELLEIVNTLKNKNIKVKVLTNGNLFKKEKYLSIPFDWIGMSINTIQDVNEYNENALMKSCKNLTIITNFGTHNIFDFINIDGIVTQNPWQVQLTIGENQLNENGISHLRTLISNSIKNIVIADNLQTQDCCNAGINACSILADGSVVPCLSVRSWGNPYESDIYQGNLLLTPLNQIWENGFKQIRFKNNCKKCRDCIKYPLDEILDNNDKFIMNNLNTIIKNSKDAIYVYGCYQPPNIAMYAVFDMNLTTNKNND